MRKNTDNRTFTFTVKSPQRKHPDSYTLQVLNDGWFVVHMAHTGQCDKQGNPYLYCNFEQDSIQYPSGLGFALGSLFEHALDHTLSDEEIQRRLDRLAQWVNDVTAVSQPSFD